MIRKNQKKLNQLNALSDAVLVFLSYLFAAWLWLDVVREGSNIASLSNLRSGMGLTALIYALWTVLVLFCFDVYRTTRIRKRSKELGSIVAGNAIALVTAAAALYLFRLQEFSRGVLAVFFVTVCTVLILKRIVLRWMLRRMRAKGYNQKHMMVVGSGAMAQRYIDAVRADAHLGIRTEWLRTDEEGMEEKLEARLQDDAIDEVIAALEPEEMQRITDLIAICEKCGTKISVIPFYTDVIPTRPTIDMVGSLKLIQLRTTPLDEPVNAAIKRGFDILASLLLIILTSPLMLIAAIGTRLSSPGPVLFKQERVGYQKKNFTMLKFRSMRVNARQDTAWSTDEDDRRTWFGSLLRKTSIDELPQFFNVLRGDMSLVGPRPEIPFYVEQFRETVPLYMVKNQVRPGITGWAQVNGLRGDTSIPERIRHDLWYIENWSFGLDLKILLRTAFGGMLNQEKLNGKAAAKKNQ